jgi:uncharacterized lipoprotein YajG
MKNQNTPNSRQVAVLSLVLCSALFLMTACSSGPDAAEIAAKYTEQTAQAIIEGSWKIAGALFLGLIINGILK